MTDQLTKIDAFDEYKLFADSTQELTARRQAAAQSYLAVNTGILAVLAFLIRDAGLKSLDLVLASLPLFAFGIMVCLIWMRVLQNYRELIAWRYDQLMQMERSPEMSGSYQFFTKERQEYLSTSKKQGFGFSTFESYLPLLLVALYTIYGLGLAIVTAMSI